ncbi:MAG: STAS/SEC14 domain-containing protein [Proteobacteria bacterium]|nr:STAS/SEC14 domain-containing protein [Pseudomonadota bacterium]
MYNILSESHDNVVGIRVEAYMRPEDYDTLLPFLADLIDHYEIIRIVTDLREFKGVAFWGLLKTLPFAFKYSSHVAKKAIITDQHWIYTWVRILSPFFPTEVRCFPPSKVEDAWEWATK